MAGQSPAKPWELARSQSTPIVRTAVAPRVPPRTYAEGGFSSALGRSPYGGYGSGGYGGGYGGMYGSSSMYGSPYGGRGMYGRSMYGRGNMYGRGYGVGGGLYGNNGMYGANGEMPPPPSGVLGKVQETLQGFGHFSQLLDGSFWTVNESFLSLMEFLNVVGELRHHAMFVVKAVTALMLLQVTGKSVKEYFFGSSPSSHDTDLASFQSYAGHGIPPAKRSIWPKVLLVGGLLLVFGPFLLRQVLHALGVKAASRAPRRIPERKVVAVYDYRAESPEELNLRTGDLVFVMDDRANPEWWKGRNEEGEVGWIPANFVETLVDENEAEEEETNNENEEPMDATQREERKRRMEVVRERRRRDREVASSPATSQSAALMQRGRRLGGHSQLMEEEDYVAANRRLSYGGAQQMGQMY